MNIPRDEHTLMEYVPCNICESRDATHLYDVPDLLLERKDVIATLVQCKRCGLIYQNPRPSLSSIKEHYPPEYEPYSDHANQSQGNWLRRKAIEYGTAKRRQFVTAHKSAGSLLDIGCATGLFLLGMRSLGGWDLYGVEFNEEVARIARERHQLDVFPGTVEQAAYPDSFFDAVTMWDVLEHLHDPAATLLEIQRILKPDGLLVIRVPNMASWDATLFGRYWAGLDAPRHLYVFTPVTLSQLLERAGLEVVEHSSAIGSYVTFVLSLRFWMEARSVPANLKNSISRILHHPVARLLSVPFFYVPGVFRRGPLLVTKSKKPRRFRNQ